MGLLHQRLVALLIQLVQEHRNGLMIYMISQAIPVDYARNRIVEEFMKTGMPWLLMVDSDIVPPMNVLDLTKRGHPIVGGVCLGLIGGKAKATIFKEAKDKPGQYVQHEYMNDSGLVEVDATGTGCIAVRRDVFESLRKPYFEFIYDPLDRHIKTGEDIGFCEKAHRNGFSVYVDKSIRCSHYKDVDLSWVNHEIVNYMSPEKVDALVDSAIHRRVENLEKELAVAS